MRLINLFSCRRLLRWKEGCGEGCLATTQGDATPMERRKSRSRPRSHVRGRSKADKRRHPDSGDRRPSRRRKVEPIVVTPEVTIPRPTVASIFQGGAEDLSSSCPTSQEPVQTVPQIFQAAGAALSMGGSMQATPLRGMAGDQADPPRDPRSQSERRRRVSIQTPPSQDDVPEGQIPVPFSGRAFQLSQPVRGHNSRKEIIHSWNHARIHINKEGQPTMVGSTYVF